MHTYKLIDADVVHLLQPKLVKALGRVGAQFMNQLHYWIHKCGHETKGKVWYYQTSEAWAEQLNISPRHFRRIIKGLQERSLINIDKLAPHKSNRTNHYSINYDALDAFFTDDAQPSNEGNSPETTKEKADKMSSPLGQNVRMVKQRIKNQDHNKSTRSQFFKSISSDDSVDKVPNAAVGIHENSSQKSTSQQNSNQKHSQQELSNTPFPNQQMLALWNETFHTNTKLTKRYAKLLNACYAERFGKDVNQFKAYLQRIQSSDYLISETFDLRLDWALQFSTIDRINKGAYGVKKAVSNVFEKKIPIDTAAEIETIQTESREGEGGEEKQFRLDLMQKIGVVKYVSWMKLVNLTITPDGEVKVKAANAFMQHRVENLIAQSGCTPRMKAANAPTQLEQVTHHQSFFPQNLFFFTLCESIKP